MFREYIAMDLYVVCVTLEVTSIFLELKVDLI